MPRRGAILLGLVALAVFPGALPPDDHRTHPDFAARIAGVRTLWIVEPEVNAYELQAGGGRVPRPDWSDLGKANIGASLSDELAAHGFAVKPFAPAEAESRDELKQVRLLYEAVGSAIIQATFANQFPEKMARFDYTLGDVRALAEGAGADALVFTYSVANISSSGRVALQVLGGAGSGIDWLIVGIVDRDGTVLWFSRVSSTTSDVRNPQSAGVFVKFATDRLPARGR
jgi:hypothetical protein